MKGRLLNVLSAGSLVVGLALLAFCLVTLFRPVDYSETWDYWSAGGGSPNFQRHWHLVVEGGVLRLQWLQTNKDDARFPVVKIVRAYPIAFPMRSTRLGFYFTGRPPSEGLFIGRRFHEFGIALWLIAAVFLALPARRLLRQLRSNRREAAGRCRACGYDLRASPDRCPECGLPVGAQSPSAVAHG